MTQIAHSALSILCSTMRALGFLTRLPLDRKWFKNNDQISHDADAFPFAGLLIGLIAALVMLIMSALGFSAPVAAFFAVITLVMVTGALHEDGLCDVADAFWTLKTDQERLRIMKDSQIGAYGTLALVFTIGLRIVLLADIMTMAGVWPAVLVLMAVEAASRGVMVWFWCLLPLARPDGTASKAGEPDRNSGTFAALASLFVFAVLAIPARGFFAFFLATGLVIFSIYVFTALCRRKIGGYTGDTLGAMQQISTVALLTGLAIHI